MNLSSNELTSLEGIGPARAEALRAVGIFSLRDLLLTLPARYEDLDAVSPCGARLEGVALVCGVIAEKPRYSAFHGITRVSATIRDDSGSLPVCWYNEPWMMKQLPVGETLRLLGRVSVKDGRRVMNNPRIVTETGLQPVYRTVKGFPPKSFRKLMSAALTRVEGCCPETLPEAFRRENRLCGLSFALRQAHFPENPEALAVARRRLSFDQMLMYLLYVSMAGTHRPKAPGFAGCTAGCDSFWARMPFPPTGAQRRVLKEIAGELEKPVGMRRLVQGDVGCGKTAVAFGAMALAVSSGFQACMMAPTEILAHQHYESAKTLLEPMGIRCQLLTGSTRAKERREILAALAENRIDALFGTHALISRDVVYGNLGLVITDEQHRFGVRQRSSLQEKGEQEETSPHVLVMSATPIPRSLALILYGDLDLSVIDEMPAGRQPVKTRLVPEEKRADMYGFLRQELKRGRQAYIVCPLVEEGEEADEALRSAKAVYDRLQQEELKDFRLALTWGGQKGAEKTRTLEEFVRGEQDVLVATTVIEVGVNNPNATIMIVENAERYGLSQLHQLRGRVGRGSEESWCFLLSETSEKLRVLCETGDGFVIAQKDLELRGPGDLMGVQQSGEAPGLALEGGVLLLDEVSQCVRKLRRDEEHRETLATLEALAKERFEKDHRSVALN